MKVDVFGVTWRPRNHFTGAEDRTIDNVTALSKPAEWHALAVGALLGAGVVLALAFGVAPAALVTAAGGSAGAGFLGGRAVEHLRSSGHIRDALREPAYAAGGAALGAGLTTGLVTFLAFLPL